MKKILTSILAILFLCLMILACNVQPSQVRILDVPQFICATSVPLPTHTQPPTSVAPPIYVPPIAGTPGQYVPRPTSTPRPTYTPWPSPTPFIVTGGFSLGADVYIGGFDSAVRLRLRIDDLQTSVIDNKQIVTWVVEIENIGSETYAALPGGQVFIAEVLTDTGVQSGQWWASAEAAQAAGIHLTANMLDAVTLTNGESLRVQLAAFTLIGTPTQIGWILDPLASERAGDLVGGNIAYWLTDAQPPCNTNPGANPNIPTPAASISTSTPTPRPDFPNWCTWCGD